MLIARLRTFGCMWSALPRTTPVSSQSRGEIVDALGLSLVRVNRTLQEIREDGLIVLSNNVLQVVDGRD
jgi:hypothetical protein